MLTPSSENEYSGTEAPTFDPSLVPFYPTCRYNKGSNFSYANAPLCRLKQTFEDGAVFIGDSFGGRGWVDTTAPRYCPSTCRCDRFDSLREEDIFSFVITRSTNDLKIYIHSSGLRHAVLEAVMSVNETMPEPIVDGSGSLSGLVLLKCRPSLVERLQTLRTLEKYQHTKLRIVMEMSLLIYDVLDDGSLFEGLGHARLANEGWLAPESWKNFQRSFIDQQIDLLEQCEIEDETGFQAADHGRTEYRPQQAAHHASQETASSQENLLSSSSTSNKCVVPWMRVGRLIEAILDLQPCGTSIRILLDSLARGYVCNGLYGLEGSGIGQYSNDEVVYLLMCYVSQLRPGSAMGWEEILLQAVTAGDFLHVQCIIHGWRWVQAEFDINKVIHNTTPLLEAVRGGYDIIAAKLIKSSADANMITTSGTALSVAATVGSESMIKTLLEQNADYHVACLILHKDGSQEARAALSRLKTAVAKHHDNQARRVWREARLLRIGFWKDHQRMKCLVNSLQNSRRFRRLPLRWTAGFELDNRKAWSIGLKVLRGVCHGARPSNLNETLLFLVLARTMACIVSDSNGNEDLNDFGEDLARWQLLFDNSDETLKAFRRAVRDIWNIELSTISPKCRPKEDVMTSFQTLALSFFSRMEQQSEGEPGPHLTDQGLLSVQYRWRERLQASSIPTDDSESVSHEFERRTALPQSQVCCRPVDPDKELVAQRDEPIVPLPDRDKGAPVTRDELVLVILMAGAILAAVIAFLLLMRQDAIRFLNGSATSQDQDTDCLLTYSIVTEPAQEYNGGLVETSLSNMLSFKCQHLSGTHTIERSRALLLAYLGLTASGSPVVEGRGWAPGGVSPSPTSQHKRAAPTGEPSLGACKSSNGSPEISESSSSMSGPSSAKRQKVPKKTFCEECNRDFGNTSNYGKHRRGPLHSNIRYQCTFRCGKSFLRNDERLKHEKKLHESLIPILPRSG